MPRIWAVVAVVLAGLAVSSISSATEPAAGASMVGKINKVRRAHGLAPLRASRSLKGSSRRFARHLMRIDYFGHFNRILASGRFRRLGEILALQRGWRLRRSSAVRGWLRSPGHRSILLSRAYRHVGAGHARGRFHGRLMTIWVVQFGRR
jgi:uncharacterized protein YkwD